MFISKKILIKVNNKTNYLEHKISSRPLSSQRKHSLQLTTW